MLTAVKACGDEISARLQAWYELGAKFDKLAAEDAKMLTGQPTDLPAKWQPILDFVWITTKAWQRAKEAAPSAFDFSYDISMLTRDSLPHVATAKRFRDLAEIMDTDLWDLALLEQQESRVHKGVVELQWLQQEIFAFEALSKEWCVKLVGSWQIDVIVKNESALHTFATLLLHWAETTECSEKRLISSRQSMWQKYGGPLDEARSRMRPWYRFGCPSAPGQLESLKGGPYNT